MIKKIEGFDKYYVSDSGEVFKQNITGEMKAVKPFLNHGGYKRVQLYNNSKPSKKFIHRLVAEAFIGKEVGKQVNHKDGNKLNNSVENLEWVTPSENIQHAIKTGLKHFESISRKVIAVDKVTGKEFKFKSLREAERITSVHASNIKKVINGKRNHAGGFSWKYESEECLHG